MARNSVVYVVIVCRRCDVLNGTSEFNTGGLLQLEWMDWRSFRPGGFWNIMDSYLGWHVEGLKLWWSSGFYKAMDWWHLEGDFGFYDLYLKRWIPWRNRLFGMLGVSSGPPLIYGFKVAEVFSAAFSVRDPWRKIQKISNPAVGSELSDGFWKDIKSEVKQVMDFLFVCFLKILDAHPQIYKCEW